MKLRVAATCATIALLTGVSNQTRAYCRTSTCSSCPRDEETGCTIGGIPISWDAQCVSFSMNEAASSAVELRQATSMMREAFAIWEDARCGDNGEKPNIRVSDVFGPAICDYAQYNVQAGNANLVMFRDDEWPYSEFDHELAATWVTIDKKGRIIDADIEINATAPLFVPSEDDELGFGVIANQRDLMSIMVHEAGHFLGLDHSRDEDSVMLAALDVAVVRDKLSPDDEAAICAIYPPDAEGGRCDYTPLGGFARKCGPPIEAGCSFQPHAHSSGLMLGVFAAGIAGFAAVRRRRSG